LDARCRAVRRATRHPARGERIAEEVAPLRARRAAAREGRGAVGVTYGSAVSAASAVQPLPPSNRPKSDAADTTMGLYPDMSTPGESSSSMSSSKADLDSVDDDDEEKYDEPATVIGIRGDIAIVRAGINLATIAKGGRICLFEKSRTSGVLLSWKEGVGLIHFSGEVEMGESVSGNTGVSLMTECGPGLLGRIVDPRGKPIDGLPPSEVEPNLRLAFADFKGMKERTNQYRSLFTGVTSVDFSVPVGRGQTMLFQGSNKEKDKEYLWADLMCCQAGPGAKSGPVVNICVCPTPAYAMRLRDELRQRGCFEDRCTLVVAESETSGAQVVAMNGALAMAEEINDLDGEAMVLMDLEPMHKLFSVLADAAGQERIDRGIVQQLEASEWTDFDGTLLRESIAERRKIWFNLVSRATNSIVGGSVSLLGWLWEQDGGWKHRAQKSYLAQIEAVKKTPRIDEKILERMVDKLREQAAAEGVPLTETFNEPALEVPGVPNWEIEELKSITDGHILLQPPSNPDMWSWYLEPYKSLPRLGTDALHPALLSVEAHKLRLKMLQGRDRQKMLHLSLGEGGLMDDPRKLEMKFVELLIEQAAGQPLDVVGQCARLLIVSDSNVDPLKAEGMCTSETLSFLAAQLLQSEAGARLRQDIVEKSEVSQETIDACDTEVRSWNSA